jgi:choline monooxygenase
MEPRQFPNIHLADLKQSPIEQAETIPSDWYHSDAIFEFEKEVLFSRFWQLACHKSEIPDIGDTAILQVADNPLLLVRADEQTINAFYNVCKHRGGPVTVKKGTHSVLQCQYHGWTYLLDGSLRGVPHFKKVDLFDKKDFGLEPVKQQRWENLLFVSLNNNVPPLSKILDGISETIAPIDLSEFQFVEKQSYQINCNWKIYVDNFLEGYHIPIVHPELAKLLDYGEYKTDTSKWYSLQHSPFQNGDNIYKTDGGKAYYYYLFPNIMLNILPGRLQTNVIRPISPTRTEVIFKYYYANPQDEKMIRDDIEYSDKIQDEDIEICELVQKGLQSDAYDKGRFSVEREKGVYHFQTILKREFANVLENQSDKI